MHYVIHAYDHPNALDRRMAARPAHIDYVGELKVAGKFLLGGALLDSAGNMIGSMLILNLETEDELTTYLHMDPYIVQAVWDKIDRKPFRQADVG